MYCIVSATGAYAAQASLFDNPSWEALLVTYKGQAPVTPIPTLSTWVGVLLALLLTLRARRTC